LTDNDAAEKDKIVHDSLATIICTGFPLVWKILDSCN